MKKTDVILDTNVLVAAAFEASTSSGRIVRAIHENRLHMVWADSTREENERVVRKIPTIEWDSFEDLFDEEGRYAGELDVDSVSYIADPTDRKFAALAEATGAALITNDDHLLDQRERAKSPILRPSEFWNRYGEASNE